MGGFRVVKPRISGSGLATARHGVTAAAYAGRADAAGPYQSLVDVQRPSVQRPVEESLIDQRRGASETGSLPKDYRAITIPAETKYTFPP